MGSMASAAANDVSNAFNYKNLPAKTAARHRAKTNATVAREEARNNPSALYKEDDRPRQSAPPRAAPAVNYGIAPVAAAPSVPDPDAIGETEQALLDQQKKGRSSTIQTSAAGLLSDEDSTRKKRSLMGSLIT